MMVRRKTFEDYEKAYPHLHYKPDHVRTEHFDGTREIMAYFDCVIDRGYGYENLHQLLADVAAGKEGLQETAKKMIAGEQHSSKRYLSEDYMFCYNVRKMGGTVWLCPWMRMTHVGTYLFNGSLAALASIGASATADETFAAKQNKKKSITNAR
jgi:hypothetical protein